MFKEGLIVRLRSDWELSNEHVRPLMLDRSLTSDTDANSLFSDTELLLDYSVQR